MYLRLSPYREVLQGVLTSLQVNEGIIKLTGKSGSGKTALCSQLFHELERNAQPAVFFLKPPASAIALQNDILDNLRLDPTGNFTRTLTAYLLAHTTAERPLVLIFDDAQQLDTATFSAIRMLCNIQDKARALVRVVLCGTEELDARLSGPALRAVTQFLNQSFSLPYLSQEQVNDFCQGYWLAMGEDMKPLSERALQKLVQDTRGQPGILYARLNQGTTGAEKNERHKPGAEPAADARPLRYAGRRQGWIPALLTLTGLLVLGGGVAYYFVYAPASAPPNTVASDPATQPATVAATQPPAAPLPAVQPPIAVTNAPEPEAPRPALEPDAGAGTDALAVAPEPVAPEGIELPPEAPAVAAAADEPAQAAPMATESAAPPAQSAEAVADAAPAADGAPPEPALPPVEDFIAAWTASWQSQDVAAYLAHYHPDFTPAQGVALEDWREQRRRVIGNARDIAISAEAPEAIDEAGDGARVVRFWLNYRAAGYADRTLKELVLAPLDGAWRIRAETNLRTERL